MPTAIGAYIFAGGFTVGVKRAGFDVLAHLEGGPYGVSTARLNWPELPIHFPEHTWPLGEYRDRVNFIYCNPTCTIFSSMGIATTRGRAAWWEDPRTNCWYRCFALIPELRPDVIAIESVCQAYTTGKPMIDELTRRALLLGYSVTHLFYDTAWYGLPQRRRRFFFVAHRAPRLLGWELDWPMIPTVGEVLSGVVEPGEYYPVFENEPFRSLAPDVGPGERFSSAWERANPQETRRLNSQGHVRGRPSFQDTRLNPARPCGAFIGNRYFHPTENRRLGTNEMKALCGYPAEFRVTGPPAGFGSLFARAVMPPVGEWLGRVAITTLKTAPATVRTDRRVFRIDLRKPGITPVDLTPEYLTAEGWVTVVAEGLDPQGPLRGWPPEPPSAQRPARRCCEKLSVGAVIEEAQCARELTNNRESAPAPVVTQSSDPVVEEETVTRPGEGSGAFIRRLWLTGRYSPDELVALVHQNWVGRTTKISDVYYNYRKLLDAGTPNLPSWPSKKATTPLKPVPRSTTITNVTKPRALITGMTPMQCGSGKTLLKLANVGDAWAEALRRLGYAVDRRAVRVGDNLSNYVLVLVGLSKPNAIACGKLFSGLEALRQRPDAIGFVDDWRAGQIVAGCQAYARDPARLWRLDRYESAAARAAGGIAYEELIDRIAWQPWSFPVLACTHGAGGDLGLLNLPARVVPLDPTPVRARYPVPENVEKTRRWLWASLVDKGEQLATFQRTWPVLAFGSRDRGKGGVGPAGENAQPRVPEPELVPEYARSWGVVSPRHAVSGSGWWRVRYEIARDVGSVLCGPSQEAQLFGPAYVTASDPHTVEELNDVSLRDLAAAQRDEFDALAWSEEKLLEELRQALDEHRMVTT